nr:alpha-tocopherol transfer protein-like isoform X1 [Parasteatoda tepidariorum]
MRFLRGSSFKTSLAVKRIKRYYACHRKHSDIFELFLPQTTLRAQSLNHITALPFRAKDNSIVLIHRLGKFDPNVCSFEELMRLDFLIFETLLTNPVTQLCGITMICDLKEFSAEKWSEFTPSRIQSIFEIYDRSLTLRIVAGHILNAPVIMNSLYNLSLNRLDPGLKEKLIFHPTGEWEELHSQIPMKILPEEYFGTLPSSGLVNLYDLINSNEDYFFELMRYGITPESEPL